jgi:hypothetical protein
VHQRDYILRIIEQLGVALAAIRRRILQGEKAGEVSAALARTAGQAGFDIDILRAFDLDTLRLFVMPTGEVEPSRCWLMAEILYLDDLEARLSERPAENSLMKARALFDLVRPAGGLLVGMPEAADRIAEIDKLLEADGTEGGAVRRRRARVPLRRHAGKRPSRVAS